MAVSKSAAARKAAKTRKARAAGKKAAVTRRRRAASKKAVASRKAKAKAKPRTGTIMHRWFDEVWNKGRVEAIDELLAVDCVIHGLADQQGAQLRGIAPFKEFYQGLRPQFDTINIDVAEVLVDGDLVAARCVVSGTQAGSGKPVNFGGVAIVRVKRGKVVEGWNHFDFDVMRQQLADQ